MLEQMSVLRPYYQNVSGRVNSNFCCFSSM